MVVEWCGYVGSVMVVFVVTLLDEVDMGVEKPVVVRYIYLMVQ